VLLHWRWIFYHHCCIFSHLHIAYKRKKLGDCACRYCRGVMKSYTIILKSTKIRLNSDVKYIYYWLTINCPGFVETWRDLQSLHSPYYIITLSFLSFPHHLTFTVTTGTRSPFHSQTKRWTVSRRTPSAFCFSLLDKQVLGFSFLRPKIDTPNNTEYHLWGIDFIPDCELEMTYPTWVRRMVIHTKQWTKMKRLNTRLQNWYP